MKKFLLIICTIMLSTIGLVLAGCSNESKTLAKNLDDTVTNLIYSVSSLDWADSEMLEKINSPQYSEDSVVPYSNINNLNYQQYNMQSNLNNNPCELDENETLNNSLNNQAYLEEQRINMGQIKPSLIQDNTYPTEPNNNYCPYNNYQNNIRNNYINNSTTNGNGVFRRYRQRHLQNQTNIANPSLQKTQNNALNSENINQISNITAESNENQVLYSTENIEKTTSEIGLKITDLIKRRADVLMQVNALYNNTVELNPDKIKAVNAYINIIKDNTSYLNSNKGIVTNQLNQACDLKITNNFSPLINAYIIRTNEALQTRLAKLNACLEAIDSILEILDSNNDIDNFSINYFPNNSANYPYNSNLENNSTLNKKLIIENKNANINQNNDINNLDNSNNIENNAKLNENNNNLNLNTNNIPLINDSIEGINKNEESVDQNTTIIKPIIEKTSEENNDTNINIESENTINSNEEVESQDNTNEPVLKETISCFIDKHYREKQNNLHLNQSLSRNFFII